ncbi:hypothetical protein KRP22_006805 [Phytophthora ramorum]|nr:hypothetical protein KRP22_2064 [Phytophthora ramorum]
MVRIPSKRSFAESTGSNSGIKVVVRRTSVSSNDVTSSRRTGRSRKGVRKSRGDRGKRRHRFLTSLHNHGGHRLRLFCGCCVEQDAINPAESPSFHWGVGFDDSYYEASNNQRLSKSTRSRLEMCGLHVTTRGKNPLGFSVDISSVGARAASFDSGFGFTCASPVSCPPPLGLAPARQPPTTLQLRSRDGTGSGKFTLNSGNGGFSSTGFKRKEPSSASYSSYTPTTPPSPFMDASLPVGTFNNTRARSRVSVGCNGWFLSDDDPSIVDWYRRCSSGEGKPSPINTHLPQVSEGSRESEANFDRELSPKRYKKSPQASGTASEVSSSPAPSIVTSPKPPLVPRPKSLSSTNSRSSCGSILLLSQDGSLSSSNGGRSWLSDSGIALVPLPTSLTSPYSFGLAPQAFDSALPWQGESGDNNYGPPTKRRRSTDSSSNSSGGFGFGNTPRISVDEVESPHIEESLGARERASFTARFSASLRLTRSHSPRALKGVLSPGGRQRKGRRSRSHSASRSRRMYRIGSKNDMSKSASPPLTPVGVTSRLSVVFIDCPQ